MNDQSMPGYNKFDMSLEYIARREKEGCQLDMSAQAVRDLLKEKLDEIAKQESDGYEAASVIQETINQNISARDFPFEKLLVLIADIKDENLRRTLIDIGLSLRYNGATGDMLMPFLELALATDSADLYSSGIDLIQILLAQGAMSAEKAMPYLDRFIAINNWYINRDVLSIITCLMEKGVATGIFMPLLDRMMNIPEEEVQQGVLLIIERMIVQNVGIEKLMPYLNRALAAESEYTKTSAINIVELLIEQGRPADAYKPFIEQAMKEKNEDVRAAASKVMKFLVGDK